MTQSANDPFHTPGQQDSRYPIFFPSVSSLKTMLPPIEYVRALTSLHHTRFLVSAYDVATSSPADRDQLLRLLFEARGAGTCILLDSGNYESYWMRDAAWTQARFHQQLAFGAWDVSFSFDDQNLLARPAQAERLSSNVSADVCAAPCPVVPIIHGTPEQLPALCHTVASVHDVGAVAVPERELGVGVAERFHNVRKLRSALDASSSIRLHLLGTGNPASMLLYALAGADSFDGLEWCQTVVDHDTGHLHHFSHYPLFAHQTPFGKAHDLSLVACALAHNLVYFSRWEQTLKTAREAGTMRDLVARFVPHALEFVDAC